MRPVLIPCLILMVAVARPAQAQDLKVLPLPGSTEDLRFPLVVSASYPQVAARINAYLQLTYLEALAKPDDKAPFRRVEFDENGNGPGVVSEFSYKASSTGRISVLAIHQSTMTSNLTDHTDWLLFDATHGQLVRPQEFFTPPGIKALGARLTKLRKTLMRKIMKDELKQKDEQIQDEVSAQQDAMDNGNTWDSIQNLEVRPGRMVFHGSLELPFAIRAYDVDLTVMLPMKEVEAVLSPYGKALLDSAGSPPALPATWITRVFQGRIGSAPCVMVLDRDGEEGSTTLDGSYAYLKHGAAISISGNGTGSAFTLQEDGGDKGATGNLRFREKGLALEGAWTSQDAKRTLPFTASAE